MKISKIILAIATVLIFTITSCRDTKSKSETTEEHGHEHGADGNHMQDENVEQEEFQVGKDSLDTKTEEQGHEHDSETHKHDDDSDHHDH